MGKKTVTIKELANCFQCQEHFFERPEIMQACASVGIEHGKDTGELFRTYMATYHLGRHREYESTTE